MAEASEPVAPAASPEPAPAKAADAGGDIARFAVAGAIVSLTSILVTIVRTKVVALTLGAAGVGVVAEVTQLVTLATVVSQLAGGPSLTAWIAAAHRQGDKERIQAGLAGAVALGVLLTGAGTLVATAVAPFVLPTEDYGFSVRVAVALAATGVVVATVTGAVATTLTALGDIRSTTKQALLSTALATPLSIGLILGLKLRGQFLSLFLGSFVSLFVMLWLKRTSLAKSIRLRPRWSGEYARRAAAIGTALVVTVYSRQLVYTSIRVSLARIGGAEQGALYNGNYQASLMIVGVYFDLALSALFTYFAPRFAAAADAGELSEEIRRASAFSLRVASPLVFGAIAFREPIIHLLYSRRFELAISMLGVQFCGDVLRAVCYGYAAPLLYRGKLRAFIITESFYVLASSALSVGLIHAVGPMGAAYAYVAVQVPYLFVVLFFVRRACGITIDRRQISASIGITAAALAFTWIAGKVPLVGWAAMPVTLVWMWKTGALDPFVRRFGPVLGRIDLPRLGRRLAVIALALVVALGIAEGVLRRVRPIEARYLVFSPDLPRTTTPDPAFVPGTLGPARFTVSSLGLRGPEAGPDGDYRVIALGGSAVECRYLDDAESWPALLGASLGATASGRPVWIASAGASGKRSRDLVPQLTHLAAGGPRVDEVITALGPDDLAAALGEGDAYAAPPPITDPAAEPAQIGRAFAVAPRRGAFYKQSAVYDLAAGAGDAVLQRLLRASAEQAQEQTGQQYHGFREQRRHAAAFLDELPDLAPALTEYRRNLAALADVAARRGVRLVLLTAPSLWRADLPAREIELLWMGSAATALADGTRPYYAPGALAAGLRRFDEVLLDVCRERKLDCFDLAARVPRDASMLYDDAHLTEAGARRAAEETAAFFRTSPPFDAAR